MVEPMENQLFEAFECEGLKGGRLFHCGDGFYYASHVVKRQNLIYVRCKTRKCMGGAKLVTAEDGRRRLQLLTQHSDGCQPEFLFEETLALRKRILDRCTAERTPLSSIFRDECNRVLPAVAATISFPQMNTAMKRARSKGTPPIPNSYQAYEELLAGRFRDTDGTEYFFKKVGHDDDESVCFIVDPLKNILITSNEVHLDGTFKVVPNVPNSRQLFTVLAVDHDHAFPVAFALMKSKTSAAYQHVLELLKTECGGLNPKLIISDFETGIKAAVSEVFPNATHKGCWFHYTQAIFKRVQRTGKVQVYNENCDFKRAVRMLMCLALLPEHQVEEGHTDTKQFCQERNIMPEIEGILTYFKSHWLDNVGAKSFSVYGQPRRTNNMQESFHHMLNGMLGKAHPNIWEFTDALCAVASGAVRDHHRLVSRGAQLTLRRRRRWVLQDKSIQREQENLVFGRVNPMQFLLAVSHHISSHQPLPTVHDDVDEDLAPLPDSLRVHAVPDENLDIHEGDEGNHFEVEPIDRDTGHRGRARGGRGRGGRGRAGTPLRGNAAGARGRGRGRRGRPRGRRGGEVPVAAVQAPEQLDDDPMLDEPQAQNPYADYRSRIITVVEGQFMPNSSITLQQEELQRALEGTREPSIPATTEVKCVMCINNRPTRLCLPCGHILMCRNCAEDFINTEQFFTVVRGDGSLMETHIRLPLVCPMCRAIIGSLPRIVLP